MSAHLSKFAEVRTAIDAAPMALTVSVDWSDVILCQMPDPYTTYSAAVSDYLYVI